MTRTRRIKKPFSRITDPIMASCRPVVLSSCRPVVLAPWRPGVLASCRPGVLAPWRHVSIFRPHSRVAQLVEQPAVNRRVAGSSPASGASPPSALQSLSDAQFSLSGAVDGLVTVSGSLSGVGSAGRVQVIEKTGRGWKAIRLLGWLLVTGGVLMLRASPATHAADARRFGWLIAGAGVSFKLTQYRPAGQ